ncbi:hypothetical protein [Montanilutibacter psychrotolerans]|uniref:DUF3828 domain-containing protein n=1 Tax=Montanilutibacter psychrotolerans TaxID=1327343 RepID=A0A3M8SYE7_9GAMM|nr:hypothetical protein [Lysobacter psychrotolerans]RNF86421.1 hypothetical protein EER27_03120 [Lysobacter psychrotolerans]
MSRPFLSAAVLSLALCAGVAAAQERTVIQAENVRYAYAEVLRVEPVYQTLTATRIEQRCDQSPRPQADGSRLSRVVGAVKDALARETPEPAERCRAVPVEREFRRPIAYDVDYVYKGSRYRSRLPEDPGNRLRIRIGVTPIVSPVGER